MSGTYAEAEARRKELLARMTPEQLQGAARIGISIVARGEEADARLERVRVLYGELRPLFKEPSKNQARIDELKSEIAVLGDLVPEENDE